MNVRQEVEAEVARRGWPCTVHTSEKHPGYVGLMWVVQGPLPRRGAHRQFHIGTANADAGWERLFEDALAGVEKTGFDVRTGRYVAAGGGVTL